jgi:predicted RNA binding protein YcfA (HicA-like mRNA interferase family)
MSRIAQVGWREFERFLSSVGCRFVRERGDHRIWARTGLVRPVVFQKKKPVPIFEIKNNLRLLGIPAADYLKIMQDL